MPLTDAAIRAAKAQEGRTIKLSDGGGLQLWVAPSGSKHCNIACGAFRMEAAETR
jgi:hypothetical protein